MKGRTIILDHFEGREAAALMVDGKLDDLIKDLERVADASTYDIAELAR